MGFRCNEIILAVEVMLLCRTAEVLRTRLKQEMTAQQRAGVTSNSSNPVADEPHPAVIVARESLTLTQTLESSVSMHRHMLFHYACWSKGCLLVTGS